MTKRFKGGAALLALGFALTACTSAPAAPLSSPAVEAAGPSEAPAAETPTPSPTADTSMSARGNLIKKIGDPFGVTSEAGEQLSTFVVTGITVDAPCTSEYASAPENGHFVKLDIQGETFPEFSSGDMLLNEGVFKVIAENGTTFNGYVGSAAAYGCLNDEERFPSSFGPAERISGSLILDVPTPTGVIVADNFGLGGWEWVYPQ